MQFQNLHFGKQGKSSNVYTCDENVCDATVEQEYPEVDFQRHSYDPCKHGRWRVVQQ